jgi:hypothetical protein
MSSAMSLEKESGREEGKGLEKREPKSKLECEANGHKCNMTEPVLHKEVGM